MEAEHPANGPRFAAHLRGFISNFDLETLHDRPRIDGRKTWLTQPHAGTRSWLSTTHRRTLGFLTDTLDDAGLHRAHRDRRRKRFGTRGPDHTRTWCSWTPLMPGNGRLRDLPPPEKNEKNSSRMSPWVFMNGPERKPEHVVQGLVAGGVDYVTKAHHRRRVVGPHPRAPDERPRIAHGTRGSLLDATGRFPPGHRPVRPPCLWCTPKAKQLLAELFPAVAGQGPKPSSRPVIEQIKTAPPTRCKVNRPPPASKSATAASSLSFLSSHRPRRAPLPPRRSHRPAADEQFLQQTLQLTARRSRSPLVISRGKSNREIGENPSHQARVR